MIPTFYSEDWWLKREALIDCILQQISAAQTKDHGKRFIGIVSIMKKNECKRIKVNCDVIAMPNLLGVLSDDKKTEKYFLEPAILETC